MRRIISVVIVDDERLARDELRFLLAAHPVEVVGEAEAGDGAVEVVLRVQPDVVFVDVQLRGESGLDLLPRLEPMACVVCVSDFDEAAIRWLEAHRRPYLLKPVNPQRLKAVLDQLEVPLAVGNPP